MALFLFLFCFLCKFVSCNLSVIISNFETWIDVAGSIRLVSVKNYENMGFGFQANRDIVSGEIVLGIPARIMISEHAIEHAGLNNCSFNTVEDKFVAFFMKENRNQNSFYKPYLELMKTAFYCPEGNVDKKFDCSHPLYWTEEELKSLQASALYEQVFSFNRSLYDNYNQLISQIVPLGVVASDSVSFREYQWLFLSFLSRTWRLPERDAKNLTWLLENYKDLETKPWKEEHIFGEKVRIPLSDTFLPGIDVFNHVQINSGSPDVILKYSHDGMYAHAIALKSIKKGQQVFITYGDKSNSELALSFGFAISPLNPENVAKMNEYCEDALKIFDINSTPAKIVLNIEYPDELLSYASNNKIQLPLAVVLDRSDSSFFSFIQVIRLLTLSKLEGDLKCLAYLASSKYHSISMTAEFNALTVAIKHLRSILSLYTTNMEQDSCLLKSSSLSSKLKISLYVRLEEKLFLSSLVSKLENYWLQINESRVLVGEKDEFSC